MRVWDSLWGAGQIYPVRYLTGEAGSLSSPVQLWPAKGWFADVGEGDGEDMSSSSSRVKVRVRVRVHCHQGEDEGEVDGEGLRACCHHR